MVTELSVRTAGPSDLEDVLALYRYLNPNDPTLSADVAETIWRKMVATPGTTVFLGHVADQAITTCMLVVIGNLTRGGQPFAIIENVVTDPAYRRRGFGKAILAAAVDRAWAMNCYKVVLTTARNSASTWAFYERAGFKRGTRTAFEMRR